MAREAPGDATCSRPPCMVHNRKEQHTGLVGGGERHT